MAAETVAAETSAVWPAWLQELYRKADALDADGFADAFATDASFTFGNGPAVVGREEIRQSLKGFFASIGSMSHRVVRVWTNPDEVIFEAVVTYGRPDGTTVDVPAVTAYTRVGEQVASCRIYCDMSPLAPDAD